MKDLSNYRKSYEKSSLDETTVPDDPMLLFDKWFLEAEDLSGLDEVNPMTLSTMGLDGFPKARIVLLKGYSKNGFVFFTNYESEKGRAIAKNPNVCISFFWPSMERQVIIKGIAARVSPEESDTYFQSRPRGSQLGAVASDQSRVLESRAVLESRLMELEQNTSEVIARPDHWGGYIIKPIEIEFWQGRADRLHDRIDYQLDGIKWLMNRLFP